MSDTTFVGIDPGLDGGVVALCPDGSMHLDITPTVNFAGSKREYDEILMCAILGCLPKGCGILVALEKQQAMRTEGRMQGTTSSFRTGVGWGLWRGIIAALKLPRIDVHPRTWQAALCKGLTGDPKERAWRVAAARFPGVDFRATPRCGKAHSGLIDACCLALYAQMT